MLCRATVRTANPVLEVTEHSPCKHGRSGRSPDSWAHLPETGARSSRRLCRISTDPVVRRLFLPLTVAGQSRTLTGFPLASRHRTSGWLCAANRLRSPQ